MLRVTPIYGSTGHHPASKSLSLPPACTLIEYGGIRILVNVGHDESFISNNITNVELPEVDAILITDSSLQALGGLPYYYGQDAISDKNKRRKKNSLNDMKDNKDKEPFSASTKTRIFATYPTVKMGQMTLYDHHSNISLDGGNPGYTLQDIDSLFTTSQYYHQSIEEQNNKMNHGNVVVQNNKNTNINQPSNDDGNTTSNDSTSSTMMASIHTLKYAQTVIINESSSSSSSSTTTAMDDDTDTTTKQKPAISITPHKAGHLIGASYFILKRLVDETEVIVAPIYHHTKEKHLDSSTLYKYGTACDVLITCCGGPGGLLRELYSPLSNRGGMHNHYNHPVIKRKLNPPSVGRDEGDLVETILSTLRRGGNVLLPVDASGRVLELVLLLNQHWEKHRLGSTYNLCWVGSMVQNTIEFAKSQLEWMAKPLGAQFDTGRGHPFSLKNMELFSSVNELEAEYPGLFGMDIEDSNIDSHHDNLNSNPMCVLASGATLDCGPARDLFLKWCENSDNTILLTDSRRCVVRGHVLSGKKMKEVDIVGRGGDNYFVSDGSGISTPILTSRTGTPLSAASAGTSDTPNIVQEDEEVPGGTSVNIGTAIPHRELSEFSTAGQLLLNWCEAKAADLEMEDVVDCDVFVPKRSALAGAELQSFLQKEEELKRKAKAEEERLAMLKEVELAKGRLRLNENDEATSSKADNSGDLKSKYSSKDSSSRPKKKSRFDANLFLKYSKPCHMTFEVREEAVGIGQSDFVGKFDIGESMGQAGDIVEDDYGIAVRPESFVDIVTGVDPSKYKGSGRIGDDALKRGLGFGADGRPLLASGGKQTSKIVGDHADVDDENLEDEELALETADLSEGHGIIRGRNNRPPVKVSTEPRRLEVLAEIAFIPLEGRVDARAARQSVRALQPRQVVILGSGKPIEKDFISGDIEMKGGNKSLEGEAALLADSIRSLTIGNRGSIFAPTDGETIELSVGHAAYSVRLIDTPYMTREEKEEIEEQGLELPSVEAHEAKVGECTVSLMDCIATGQRVAADGSIVLAPRRHPESNKHSAVMLSDGDVLLTDLRSEVIAQGMKAEYSAHVGYAQLIVNGKIVVRKDQATGEIDVEGPLCEDFFIVRSVVCGQYVSL